ncbi:cell division suppressor protein YneA [Paenibacillus arenilitoris]|uniref:LysM peptidoglycan-binding domain-containing protein n=1 Tax=Paenibacillus arenilitoris TaxID=2772299 RepID=A0A927CQ09_9BACL|nr:LysM peptidoglycan-binding domain-containing protein [Paenibacillus arenilitoris]MBD2869831.1 LysM peptidoglycan-binding domain-containing protein [Paenibacillus arenilitoris]
MTSPSFYRTIHKREESGSSKLRRIAKHLARRHAVKLLVSVAVFVLLFTSFLMMGTDASGTAPASATPQEQVVTVQAGDTLWTIAKRFGSENEDVRYVIYLIKDRNELRSADIKPGQKLIIPAV